MTGPRGVGRALAFLTAYRLVVNTAQRLVYPFLPAIARGLGVPLGQAGFLVSARWAAGLITPVVVTVAGRGERRRRLVVLGLVLFAVGAAVTAATNAYVGALVGFLLMGVAKPVYDVAAQSYVADRVPYRRRARYVGAMELTWAGGLLVGAPVAGWLIDRFDWNTPFSALAAVAVAGLVVTSAVLDADDAAANPSTPSAPLAIDGAALAFVGVVVLFSAGAEVVFVAMGAWLEETFGLSLVALGGLATLIGGAELVGEGFVAAFADRVGKRRTIAAGVVVSGGGFLLLAALQNVLAGGMAGLMVAFLGFEVAIVASIPYATEVRPRARARFLSWMIVAMAVGRTAGAAFGAALYVGIGLPANALAAVAANGVALVLLLTMVSGRAQPTM